MRPASTQGSTIRSTGLGGRWPGWMRPAVLAAAVVVVGGLGCGDDSTGPPASPPPPPPPPPVATTVAVSPVTAELSSIGETVQLSAEVLDQTAQPLPGAAVAWASDDTLVANVDSTGLVTARGNGTATVTATSGSASGSAAVMVMQSASSVTVTPAAKAIGPGDTLRLAAEAFDENGQTVEGAEFAWSSSEGSVATVTDSGLVRGVAEGTATITATSGSASGSAAVMVMQSASSVTVTPAAKAIGPGDTLRLAAEAFDENGQTVEGAEFAWSSSEGSVATVTDSGLVRGVAEGTATITATSGSASGSAAVMVMQSASSVTVTPAAKAIGPGDTLRLAAEAFDENGQTVEGAEFAWSSSEGSVATVTDSGLVRGVAEGTATITAAAGDARGAAEITVANPDRAALVSLYNATDGPNWLNSDNWLTDAPLGDWYGVDTDVSGRVETVILSGRYNADGIVRHGLTGEIPPAIGDLTNLKHLSLRFNELTGGIPSELGNLTSLERLDLGYNRLTGGIPLELGNLTNLRELWISRNDLTGKIPAELGNLTNLRELWVQFNRLSGAIPPELGNLVNLRSLSLWKLELSGRIPPELGNLVNLEKLHLTRTYLTGPIPLELGNLRALEELWLAENALTGPIPPELGSLTSLERLDLGYNLLAGRIPAELSNLTNLKLLELADNDLTGPIPSKLGTLSNLERLTLANNDLAGAIPPELGNLAALEMLWLNGNSSLLGLLPRSLINLEHLRELRFHDSGLCAPADQVFQAWLDGLRQKSGEICDSTLDHRQAVMAVYESAGGANWTASANWGSDRPLSEWHGVTVDTANRVVELDLSANGLEGTLSLEVGGLETLERLRLRDNPALGGHLPPTIRGLLALDEFDIEGTGLCLPPSAGFLDWLRGVNRFNGERCHDDNEHTRDTAPGVPLNGVARGELDYAGDQDLFHVDVPGAGALSVRTGGDTETWLEFEDGNAVLWGEGSGSMGISWRVPPGRYVIRVAGVQRNTTGAYSLVLSFEPLAPPARAYLTQAVQSHDAAVPLVAGEDALLRVFVTAPEGADATMPPVRATFHAGGAVASVIEIPAGSAAVPVDVRAGELSATANAVIPGSVLVPGLEMVVEIDPEGTLDPALGIGGRIPDEGRLALDVRGMPDFHVTAVPLLQAQDPDSSGFKATVGLTAEHEVFYESRDWLPVADMEVAVREPLRVDYDPRDDLWRTLQDIEFLRVADGASGYYMGVPPWIDRGTVGMAYLPGKSSVSRFEGWTVAHEFGHNLSLRHTPCGEPAGVDPYYPHRGGVIGVWGYDFRNDTMVDPELYTDLMTYCRASAGSATTPSPRPPTTGARPGRRGRWRRWASAPPGRC